jgi:hypothetical protein
MRDEVTGEWIKLYKEELNDLNSPPNIVRVIKSRRKRWVAHVASVGEVCIIFWFLNLRERNHMEDIGVDGTIILRYIFTQ